MKYFYLLFGLIPALLAGNPAFAQISIDEVDAKEDKVTFQDKLKSTSGAQLPRIQRRHTGFTHVVQRPVDLGLGR